MLIAARNAMMVKNLPYDAEVEWLEATGSQRINTGIYMHNTLAFKFRFCPIANSANRSSAYLGGAYAAGGVDTAQVSFVTDTSGYSGNRYMDRNIVLPAGTQYNTWHYYENNNIYLALDGVKKYWNAEWPSSIAVTPINIFAILYQGNYIFGKCKLRDVQILDNNNLICDLVSVRRTIDGVSVGEMYDRVTGTFLERHGTFIIGPDIAGGGGYKRKCVRRLHRRSLRPSARFRSPSVALAEDGWRTPLWKEVA